ncbi:hypothetical protein [Azoarcus sp. DD4]|uniref:hypothetical protein n=1 Tax=Azoarcus sp. DD4 TaxID=2027405 RepID=UPI001129DDF3|nr:hypothetical protein [Azoarcus sp. DD4]
MSLMRLTNGQILPDCPMVIGFGGWGVLGASLPQDGEQAASLGRVWGTFPGDSDAEFWIVVTRQPINGRFYMWPDTSWEYIGASDFFTAQLYLNGAVFGLPQTVTLTSGVG